MAKQVEMFPDEASKVSSFVVTGYIAGRGNVTQYYLAKDELQVGEYINAIPLDNGGYSSYSIEEVDSLPDEAYLACPSCDHKFQDKYKVTKVE